MTTPSRPIMPQLLELLEARIAPAGLPIQEANVVPATLATPAVLKAGDLLSTEAGGGGAHLLYVEQGQAKVFFTDLNGNDLVDSNEITGIAAGNGLRLVAFTDINGDIVTNLQSDGRTLTDSDQNPDNGRDGTIVLNNRIDSIVLRSLTAEDTPAYQSHLVKSSYSIFGNIYAGGGLGLENPGAGKAAVPGLRIDTAGFADQQQKFGQLTLVEGENPVPSIGFVMTGTATSGQEFSFGTSPIFGDGPGKGLRGTLAQFVPAVGQQGGDVFGVRSGELRTVPAPVLDPSTGEPLVDPETGEPVTEPVQRVFPSPFHFGGIITGDGGFGARGGDIADVNIYRDIGGLVIQSGSGGDGPSGGRGGDIESLSIQESINQGVRILTGDGGFGLLGAAGRAGVVAFNGEMTLYGRVEIGLGDGGGASGNAGAGTSLGGGQFTNPGAGLPTPTEVVTTWRRAGDIGDYDQTTGQTRLIDFDGDGYNDVVFLSDNPSQAVVLFGNAAGDLDFRPGFSDLQGSPSYAPLTVRNSAIVVLDAGGPLDSRSEDKDDWTILPDIVTASSSGNSYGGLLTFINKGFDRDGDWLGFALPRYSPLPGSNIPGVSPASVDIARTSTAAITALAAGDFTRDGIMDVAVIETRYDNTNLPWVANLIVMSGLGRPSASDPNVLVADGYFAADFNQASGTVNKSKPAANAEFGRSPDKGEDFVYQLKASAVQQGDARSDVLAYLDRVNPDPDRPKSTDNTRLYAYYMADTATGQALTPMTVISPRGGVGSPEFLYSQRIEADIGGQNTWVGYSQSAPQRISAYNFEFLDADGDGFFDAVAIGNVLPDPGSSSQPYLAAAVLQGSYDPSTGAPTIQQPQQQDTFNSIPSTNASYYGIALTEKTTNDASNVPSVLDTNWTATVNLGMATGSYNAAPGTPETNLVLNVIRDGVSVSRAFAITGFGQYSGEFDSTATVPGYNQSAYTQIGAQDRTRTSLFSPWIAVSTAAPVTLETVGFWDFNPGVRWRLVGDPLVLQEPISVATLRLQAGDGGDSSLGRGGDGGSIGRGAVSFIDPSARTGSLVLLNWQGAELITGAGGSGYTAGGNAGAITGIVMTANVGGFITGAGGSSLAGLGGKGGDIRQIDFTGINRDPQLSVATGHGGFGQKGGSGGTLFGRGDSLVEDARNFNTVSILTGSGGAGVRTGGNGGDISKFTTILGASDSTAGRRGEISYIAGGGGSAIAGVGGAGGSIISSAPKPNTSEVSRSLVLEAGAGGNGLTGGGGGRIDDFRLEVDIQRNPESARVLAGHAGSGVTGKGGVGGQLKNISITSDGVLLEQALLGVFMAGNGGLSAAATGGAGGAISALTASTTSGGTFVVAGVGGDGLVAGGIGGAIMSANLNAGGASTSKIVAMAGPGGDAYGVTGRQIAAENSAPVPLQGSEFSTLFALGNLNGMGGSGGSVQRLSQLGNTLVSTDIIAGNGGNIINYGMGSDAGKVGVGRGGSVVSVNLMGDAGIINSKTDTPQTAGNAIRNYDYFFADQVRAGTITSVNSEGVGNVGVVVGAKGNARNDVPVTGGQNGKVDGFRAGNIMSMVAGSVDRIAAIQSINALQLQPGGTIMGAGKESLLTPNRDLATQVAYLRPESSTPPTQLDVTDEPQYGGKLIDGLVWAGKYTGLQAPASTLRIR